MLVAMHKDQSAAVTNAPSAMYGQCYIIIRIPIFIRPNTRYDHKIGLLVARMKQAFGKAFKGFAAIVDVGKPEMWLTGNSESTESAFVHITTEDKG
jgi:hypothetical protein